MFEPLVNGELLNADVSVQQAEGTLLHMRVLVVDKILESQFEYVLRLLGAPQLKCVFHLVALAHIEQALECIENCASFRRIDVIDTLFQ